MSMLRSFLDFAAAMLELGAIICRNGAECASLILRKSVEILRWTESVRFGAGGSLGKLDWKVKGWFGTVLADNSMTRVRSGSRMIQHVTAVWKFRHFLMALVKLDLRQRYRRSVLGIGWSLLNPIAMTVVFTVVFSNLLGNGDPIGYAASVLDGMAVWGFLRDSRSIGCRCFMTNEAYIRQSPCRTPSTRSGPCSGRRSTR